MNQEELDNINLLNTALSVFVDDYVYQVEKSEYLENFVFFTAMGLEGYVDHNTKGNYNVWFEGELVYEIEGVLFDAVKEESGQLNLVQFYRKMRKLEGMRLKRKSKGFVTLIMFQLEKILLNPLIPIEGGVRIGTHYVFPSRSGEKFIVNLN